ncbi:MAG: hypothetical protein K1Y01_17575 [Vicinamibacteria bacterium]|nr:hypothetical protein [Vicinamibacteria bacterium]
MARNQTSSKGGKTLKDLMTSPPFRECPLCKAPRYGVVILFGGEPSYQRRCLACGYDDVCEFPALSKSIVYVDQFLISNVAKLLDPESRAVERVRQEPFWTTVYKKLTRLVRLHAVSCPQSLFHDEESLLSGDPSFDSLETVYEHFSGGVRFKDSETILSLQAQLAFARLLDPAKFGERRIERQDVLTGNHNAWLGHLRVKVQIPRSQTDIQELRRLRHGGAMTLNAIFREWQSRSESYADTQTFEARSFGPSMIKLTREYYQQVQGSMVFAAPPPAAVLVNTLRSVAERAGVPGETALVRVVDFLRSGGFCDLPRVELSSHLYASMARKAASGQKRLPSSGFSTDVVALSTLLPFCDAMFVDNEIAGFFSEEPLKSVASKFGAKLFSLRTKGEFLEYLDDLERRIEADVLSTIADVYPPGWLDAPAGLIVAARQRRVRDSK